MKLHHRLVCGLATATTLGLTACDSSKPPEGLTNPEVQRVIKELGLVYVEEGAQYIITYDEVLAAQQAWCDALIKIGKTYEEGGDYRQVAKDVIASAYNYEAGKVFFKPTLAFGDQTFRNDAKGALSYFVGGDPDYPTDTGFALKGWKSARFENSGGERIGIQIYGSVAITMGNVFVTDKDGNETMVNKTWVFKKGKDGKLRIIVHNSSLPFVPQS